MAESESNLVDLPLLAGTDVPAIMRHGLGYRGVWHRQGIVLELKRLHRRSGELSAMLDVGFEGRDLSYATLNVCSSSARGTLAKRLARGTAEFNDRHWDAVLEQFCRGVLHLEDGGPPSETIGDRPMREGISYLLDPVVPDGTPAMIFGPPGAMKSTVAAAVALSVQTGVAIVPGWTPQKRNVLVLDWEASQKEWNDRLVAVANGVGLSSPSLQYRRLHSPLATLVEYVAGQVTTHDIGLLIVDSMMPAVGTASREGGDASETSARLFEALALIGVTSLIIGQVTAEAVVSGKPAGRPYGSIAQMYEVRSMWELLPESESQYTDARELVLAHRKVNVGRKLPAIELRVIHGTETILFEPCHVTAPDLVEHVGTLGGRMAWILERRGPMTTRDLAEEVGSNEDKVRVTANRDKRFVRLPDKRWRLAEV